MEKNKDFKTKKFLLSNSAVKIYEKDVLNKDGILSTFYVDFMGEDVVEKIYFDTVDRFFFSNGIIINIVKSKMNDFNRIIVRFEGEDKRIPFISYMPKNLVLDIDKKDFFSAHFDFITESINAIMPAGLSVDVASYVSTIIPVFVVTKKCKKYRIVNNSSLKVQLSFEAVDYVNNATRNSHRLSQLELRLEDNDKEELFEEFVKRLVLQVPTIIQMKNSDLLNGLDYTSITQEKKDATDGTSESKTDKKHNKTPNK